MPQQLQQPKPMRSKRFKLWECGTGCTTLLAVLLLSSACTSVQIPNVTFYGSLGPSGAAQFDLMDSNTSMLTLQQFAAQWNDLSNTNGPLICMRTADFSQIKADLETLCSWVNGGCTQAQQQALDNLSENIDALKEKK